MMVHRTPFFLPLFFPSSLVWRIPANKPEIYLTFDDGPVPGPTDFVLEILAKYEAKATVFCIGDNIRKNDGVFRQIINAGHAVGNHTFNHLNGWKTSVSDYRENVARCDEIIRTLTTSPVSGRLFRPPYGRIKRNQIHALSDFEIIMWDVLTMDYRADLKPESCLRGSIRATRPGSVVVFHDSYKAEKNLNHALPRFLDHFANRGFTFRSLPTS